MWARAFLLKNSPYKICTFGFFADKWAMAGSSFALDSLDRNDLALDLLDTDGLFGELQFHHPMSTQK